MEPTQYAWRVKLGSNPASDARERAEPTVVVAENLGGVLRALLADVERQDALRATPLTHLHVSRVGAVK